MPSKVEILLLVDKKFQQTIKMLKIFWPGIFHLMETCESKNFKITFNIKKHGVKICVTYKASLISSIDEGEGVDCAASRLEYSFVFSVSVNTG